MPASPSSVISMGLGSWGSVHLLPTLGYGIGAAADTVDAPPCLAAGMLYMPGMPAGDLFKLGARKGQLFRIGIQEGMKVCDD